MTCRSVVEIAALVAFAVVLNTTAADGQNVADAGSTRTDIAHAVAGAQGTATTQARTNPASDSVDWRGSDSKQTFTLVIEPLSEPGKGQVKDRMMVLLMSWAPECRYPAVLEVPVQIDATAFQLKRMAQLATSRTSGGECVESLATVYDPDDFHYVSRATTLVMHLPTGPVAWPPEALKLAASRRPPSAAPHEIPEGFKEVPGQIIMMAGRGRAQEARERAEALARFYVARPPSESLQFFAALAMTRRQTNDLAGAATAYGVATLIASAANDASELAGIVYDNLATVRRLQGQYPEATTASDRALEILAAAEPKGRAHGGALNNRATLLADQSRYQDAVAYSDRALTILKEVLNPKELAPFIKDNALFREKAAGR